MRGEDREKGKEKKEGDKLRTAFHIPERALAFPSEMGSH